MFEKIAKRGIRRSDILLALLALLTVWILYSLLSNLPSGGQGGDFSASAQRAVEAQGYTNVQYTGVDNFACGETAGFAFDANNVNRVRVHLVACSPDALMNFNKGWWIVIQ